MMGNNLRFHRASENKEWLDFPYIGSPIWAHFTAHRRAPSRSISRMHHSEYRSHEVDLALYLFVLVGHYMSARLTRNVNLGVTISRLSRHPRAFVRLYLDCVSPIAVRDFRIIELRLPLLH